MNTELVTVLSPNEKRISYWEPNEDDLRTVREHLCRDLDDHEFKLFLYVAKARGLNPLLKQIYAVKYPGYGDRQAQVSHITSIDGYLLIAERTGEYEGHELEVFDGKSAPIAVCTVYRKNKRPCKVVCDYWEFCQTRRGRDGKEVPTKMWAKMPKWMIGKVALARGLARAFPEELGGIYTNDEMPPPPDDTNTGNVSKESTKEPEAQPTQDALVEEARTKAGVGEHVRPEMEPAPAPVPEFTSVHSPKPIPPGTFQPMIPSENNHPAYRAWLTELSKGGRAKQLIGSQNINFLRGYLNKHVAEIPHEEVRAINLVLAEMGRQFAVYNTALTPRLKQSADRLDEAFAHHLPLPTTFAPELYTMLGQTLVAGGKHSGRKFEELDTDYLNGHYEVNRGNFDPRYEQSLLEYVTLRKLKEKKEREEFANDSIPPAYLGEAKHEAA